MLGGQEFAKAFEFQKLLTTLLHSTFSLPQQSSAASDLVLSWCDSIHWDVVTILV
jgi:hypothetical protein